MSKPVTLGVNLWTVYGWTLAQPIEEDVIRALAEMGSQSVELVMDEDHNTSVALVGRAKQFSAFIRDLGMEIPSVATTLFWKHNLASRDEAVRARAITTIEGGCRAAEAYRAGTFLVVAGQQEPETEYRRSYETAVESLRRVAGYAADRGVTIGVENVSTSLLGSPGEYAQFIRDVDHPAVRAYLDFGNGAAVPFGTSYAENWITAVAGMTAMLHAKDYDRNAKAFAYCGLGSLDWRAIFAAIAATGYRGHLLIETPPMGGRETPTREAGLHAARTSLGWLSRFV